MSKKSFRYSEEDIDFIRENIDTMSYKKMAIYFSEKYNMNFMADSISHLARRRGLTKNIRVYKNRKNNSYKNIFSEEMCLYLKDNFEKCTRWKELTDLFNEKFKTNYTRNEIAGVCRRKYNLKLKNPTVFTKENHPFKANIGEERIGSGGKICVKVTDYNLTPGDSSNWKQKSRFVYEKEFGEIPNGSRIIHLNGDVNDFSIDNLYCVNKEVMACLARERWFKKNKEITITAVKCAELMCVLKGDKK